MAVVGEAYINIVAKTEGFGTSLEKGVAPGLQGVEHQAEATGSRSGKKLAGGLSGALSGAANLFGVGFLSPLTEGVDKAGEHFDHASAKSSGFRGQLQSLGGGVALGAAAAVGAVGFEAIKSAGEFDHATGKIAASAGISVEAAKKIGASFLTTGGQTTFTAEEMATAYAGVAGQLGATQGHALSAKEALLVMKAAGDEAEATGTDLATATGALSKTMQAFHIDARDAAAATDILSNVSHDTGLGVDGLSTMLGKLHTALGANAPNLLQSSALLDSFAKHGITGRGAMTAMTASLTAMVNPSDKQKAALDAMGVSLTDANGKFIGIGPAMDALKGHLGANASESDKAAMATLFHGKTLGQLTPLIQEGSAAFDKNAAAVGKADSAHKAAEKASDNLHGQMQKLKGAVMDQVTQWGEKLMPVLLKVGTVLAKIGTYIMEHKALLIAFGVVIGTVLVAAFVSWAAGAAAAAVATIAATWPILLIIAAIGLVVAAIIFFVKHWHQIWEEVKKVVKAVVDWLVHAWDTVVDFFKKLPGRILGALKDFGKLLLGWAKDAIELLVKGFMEYLHLVEDIYIKLPMKLIGYLAGFAEQLWSWAWSALKAMAQGVTDGAEAVWTFFTGLPGKVLSFLGNGAEHLLQWGKDLITGLLNGIKSMAGMIGGAIKGLFDDIPGVSILKKIPGLSWLATGGIVTSPTLAVVGEAGPEVVLPLSKIDHLLKAPAPAPSLSNLGPFTPGATGGPGGLNIGGHVNFNIHGDTSPAGILNELSWFAKVRV